MFENVDLLITKYNYKLNEICRALNINKSSYLYWKSTGKLNKEKLASFYCDIISFYTDSNGIYGSPRIATILNNKGIIKNVKLSEIKENNKNTKGEKINYDILIEI